MSFMKQLFGRGQTDSRTYPLLEDKSYPLILLAGEDPDIDFTKYFDLLANSVGLYRKDVLAPGWDEKKSIKAYQVKSNSLNAEYMLDLARNTWGPQCLENSSYAAAELPLAQSMVLVIKRKLAPAGPLIEDRGYVPGFFPKKAPFRFESHEFNFAREQGVQLLRTSITNLLANYHFNFGYRWAVDQSVMDFEVLFNSGRELESFMSSLREISKRFGYKRENFFWWKTCKHGRYFCYMGSFSQGWKTPNEENGCCIDCNR